MVFGFGGDALGLGLGARDDRGRLVVGLLLLALVFGEQLLGFFLQPARLVELGLDALGAVVERADQHLRHADIDQDADEDHEGDGDPEFGFENHRRSLSA